MTDNHWKHFGCLGYDGVCPGCTFSLTLKILFILLSFMWPPPCSVQPFSSREPTIRWVPNKGWSFSSALSFQRSPCLFSPYAALSPKITCFHREREKFVCSDMLHCEMFFTFKERVHLKTRI